MKLFEAVLSSAAFRVRIALNVKGLAYESAVLDLRAGDHLTPEFTRTSPLHTVPALVDGERTLIESMAIIEYLDETHREPPLLPRDAPGRARVRAIAQLVACDIHPLNNLRVLRWLKHDLDADDAARDRWMHHWIHEGFTALESMLVEGAGFCHGEAPTLADICVVPQVVNAQRYKVDLSPYPRIQRVFDTCMKVPAFDRAHPKNHPAAT
jgi:maleylacetoacetate isomerase